MYEIIKSVIQSKDYELREMLHKINKMYIESAITETEKTELDELARINANIDNSIDEKNKLKEIDKRISNLEIRIYNLENKDTEEGTTEEIEKYPAFEEGKWYYKGDTCSENNKNYIFIAPEGQVCVWAPSQYPAYWEEVIESEEQNG